MRCGTCGNVMNGKRRGYTEEYGEICSQCNSLDADELQVKAVRYEYYLEQREIIKENR